jgi:hypothetical protein
MHYSLHELDKHHVVATTVAADRDEALEWFSEKLRLMLTFEGDPVAADYVLDEWPEGLLAHSASPTIPVFVVRAVAAHPQASQGAGCGQIGAGQSARTQIRELSLAACTLQRGRYNLVCVREPGSFGTR